MHTTNMIRLFFWRLLAVFLVLFTGPALAGETMDIAGEITATNTPVDSLVVPDVEGHLINFGQSTGTNKSTGKHSFLDGASYAGWGIADYVKGNGMHRGYNRYTLDGAHLFSSYEGTTTTVMNDAGLPVTTFKGSFTYLNGTGKYAGIQGSGTYNGKVLGPQKWTVKWQGSYTKK